MEELIKSLMANQGLVIFGSQIIFVLIIGRLIYKYLKFEKRQSILYTQEERRYYGECNSLNIPKEDIEEFYVKKHGDTQLAEKEIKTILERCLELGRETKKIGVFSEYLNLYENWDKKNTVNIIPTYAALMAYKQELLNYLPEENHNQLENLSIEELEEIFIGYKNAYPEYFKERYYELENERKAIHRAKYRRHRKGVEF